MVVANEQMQTSAGAPACASCNLSHCAFESQCRLAAMDGIGDHML
jgi:hypothetical protein